MKTRFFTLGATAALLCAAPLAAQAQTADEFQLQTLSAIAAITGAPAQVAETPEEAGGDELRRLTDDIARQVRAFGDQGPSQRQQQDLRASLERLVTTASAQGLDTVYVNALVAEATGEDLQGLQEEAAPAPLAASVEAQVVEAVANAAQGDESDPYFAALSQENASSSAVAQSQPPAPRAAVRTTAGAAPPAPVVRATPAVARASQPVRRAAAPEPARQQRAAAPQPRRREDRTHVVASGETLGAIAARYYGSYSAYRRIYDANRDRLSNPNVIRVGQRLRIPR